MDDSSLGGNKSKCVSEILSAPYSEQDNCHETGWWIKLKMIHLFGVLLSILKLSSSLFLENNCALTIPDISPSFLITCSISVLWCFPLEYRLTNINLITLSNNMNSQFVCRVVLSNPQAVLPGPFY